MIGRCIGRRKGRSSEIEAIYEAMKRDAVTGLVLVQISWGSRTPNPFRSFVYTLGITDYACFPVAAAQCSFGPSAAMADRDGR